MGLPTTAKVLILRRSLPARPNPSDETLETLQHARAVKAFVRDYTALQEQCQAAFSRNHQDRGVELIDAMKRLERRITFLPDEPAPAQRGLST
jgi:hypothetical protein